MNGWESTGRGEDARLVATLAPTECSLLSRLFAEIIRMLAGRSEATPQDELAELTGIRTGPTRRPEDRVLARLLPDFTAEDPELAAGLRSLHEPALIEAKQAAAQEVLDGLPPEGGEVELTVEQADIWLTALNDARLALGTALDVSEDTPDELPEDDPRSGLLEIYQWLTVVQDTLVLARVPLL